MESFFHTLKTELVMHSDYSNARTQSTFRSLFHRLPVGLLQSSTTTLSD